MNLPFSTSCQGIGGQIKRRYSDFLVEEITPEGRACQIKRFIDGGTFEALEIPPKPEGLDQLHVDLEKVNSDLQWVIKQTARFLQGSRNRFGYAGLKDKRAITCQRVSLFAPDVERLQRFQPRGFYFRNPKWSSERIEIGRLKGNRFTLVVRDLDLSEDEIKKRFDAFKTETDASGLANYFGEQRFGGQRNVTHLVGKKIIQGDFESAVMTYLTHASDGEDDAVIHVRRTLAEGRDFKKALQTLDPKYRTERTMLSHLNVFPRDFAGAIQKLPKGMRFLFTHAYQSHLFNLMLAKRLAEGNGLAPQAGDRLDEDNIPMLALIGHETVLDDSPAGKLAAWALAEEGVSTSQFQITRGLPEATSKGGFKALALFPQDLRLLKIEDDAFFPSKRALTVAFTLPKGCYATTVLDELQKTRKE